MMDLVIATSNHGKLVEIRFSLEHPSIRILSLKDFPHVPEAPEDGNDFDEIARRKAQHYWDRIQLPVLAEDSGLVIPSLRGFPGIFSARVASTDPERIAVVIDRLRGVADRRAYYHCSMCLKTASGEWETQGRCDGTLLETPRGNLGFGYDPIFLPVDSVKTFGEMNLQEKAEQSHRGRAARQIASLLHAQILIDR
jgi:XTP/dITP diphosphohydrolase